MAKKKAADTQPEINNENVEEGATQFTDEEIALNAESPSDEPVSDVGSGEISVPNFRNVSITKIDNGFVLDAAGTSKYYHSLDEAIVNAERVFRDAFRD